MGRFLRDQELKNLSINEEAIIQLCSFFIDKAKAINERLKEDIEPKTQIVTFIIRYDGKGYRHYDARDLLDAFRQAKDVERIVIQMESAESSNSNQMHGTHIHLRLDKLETEKSYLTVSSEDRDWVESTFPNIIDLLQCSQNKNYLIRNNWTPFIIQITGVLGGFALSLWAGLKIAPFLAIENAFVVSFFFAFLIFSNAWTYINQQVLNLTNHFFPNIKFLQPNKQSLHWLGQALIAGLVVAPTIFLIDTGFEMIGKILKEALFK